jgi:hypothetical protein
MHESYPGRVEELLVAILEELRDVSSATRDLSGDLSLIDSTLSLIELNTSEP